MKPKPSLAETHPELAAQADGWDPTTLAAGSKKKVGWKCEQDHTWLAIVASRKRGNGCPICSNKKVLAGFNDLATTNPELAAQADGWNSASVTKGSNKKVAWRCQQGHSWQAIVNDRSKGKGCPICTGRAVLLGFNDLVTVNPEIAAQADGWDPKSLTAGSGSKVRWKCELGHTWNATVANRSIGGGCPVCSGHSVLIGFNDLSTTNPELAAQADGWDPKTLTGGSRKNVAWRCEHGHLWNTRVDKRSNGSDCPVCSRHKTQAGFNDLATTNPELAAQANGWDPTSLAAFSKKIVSWRCAYGHVWKAMVSNRSKGSGCAVCAGHKVLVGFNDLATVNPELAAQANGWDPKTLTAGSGRKVAWKCEDGHLWNASVLTRSKGHGCPVCSGQSLLAGFNDLATMNPGLAAEADGWDPATDFQWSEAKVGWKCELGHTWKARISRRSGGTGCPTCATSGFDPNKDGWLYLIYQDELQMFQIGISNFPETRLGQHSRGGWVVIQVRGPMEGHLAQQLETAILHAVERRGAVLGHKARIEKFDGYSEAWTKASLVVASIKQLLDWVYEDESQ